MRNTEDPPLRPVRWAAQVSGRISRSDAEEIERLARAARQPRSEILREAVRLGLPLARRRIEAGRSGK